MLMNVDKMTKCKDESGEGRMKKLSIFVELKYCSSQRFKDIGIVYNVYDIWCRLLLIIINARTSYSRI